MTSRGSRKTAAKTAVVLARRGTIPPTIRQPHGGALLSGGVPGNKGGTGRPRSEVRQAALEGAAKAVPRLEQIVTRAQTNAQEVIAASRLLLEFGVGRQVEVEETTPPERRMPADETVRGIVEVLPILLRNGLLTPPELLVIRTAIDESLAIQTLLQA